MTDADRRTIFDAEIKTLGALCTKHCERNEFAHLAACKQRAYGAIRLAFRFEIITEDEYAKLLEVF